MLFAAATPRRLRPARLVLTASAVALPLGLTGCATTAAGDAGLEVVASFYPLQYVAEQVGGDRATVGSLTPPGAEPHDVELSPRQVRTVGDADVVMTLSGFQPSVDEAVAARSPQHLVDAALTPAVAEHMAPEDEEGAAEEADDGHDHEAGDPHFWLDPTLLAAVATETAATFAEADPENADTYTANAETLVAELEDLDAAFTTGLAECDRTTVVTAHAAFGFLAERYGLEQVGISGIDPEAEPSPARLREVREVVAEHDVTTLFTETLLDPQVAEVLAADLGLETAVLDPVESQADEGTDYRGAMEQNLEALRSALGCR